jgi:hypothetical protein
MAQPRIYDVRRGLTADLLLGLRRADRASLAVKDDRTAAFGFWVGDELGVALIESDPLIMQVRRLAPADVPGTMLRFSPRPAQRRPRGVVFDTHTAAMESFWSRLLGLVRPEDILRLGQDFDKPGRLLLHVYANQSRVASMRVPLTGHAQSVA